MMKCYLFFVMLAGGIAANDITLSKDSIWICNSNTSSKIDMVTLTNNGPEEAGIDSIGVHFSELDTAGFSHALFNNRFESLVSEIYRDKNLHRYGNMKPAGDNEYRILFAASGKRPFSMNASGDSVTLADVRFGGCFICNSLPRYPRYLEGTLCLYFSNGETDTLRFCSGDLRPPVAVAQPTFLVRRHEVTRGNAGSCLINGRLVSDEARVVNLERIRHRLYKLEINE